MKRSLNLLFRLLIGVFGLCFLWAAGAYLQADWTLHQDASVTEGRVVKVLHEVAYGSRRLVEFTDAVGETHRFINAAYYHGSYGPTEGASVPVRYSLKTPEKAAINTLWGRYGTTGEFLLIGLFGVGSALVAARKR